MLYKHLRNQGVRYTFIADFWGGRCAIRKALKMTSLWMQVGNKFNKEIPITF